MVAGQQELRASEPTDNTAKIAIGLKITAWILAIAFPLMAVMGSEALYKANDTLRTTHEMSGNILFLVAIAQVALAFAAQRSGLLDMSGVVIRGLFVLFFVAQFGLGYVGRENIDVRVWHIPNGVLLTVLAALILGMSFRKSPT